MERSRQYGRRVALAVAAVAAVAVAAGFLVAANLGGDHGRARDGAQPAAPSSTAPTPPDLGTPLADCPEAMRFFERPEVKAFQQRLGRAPLPSDGFIGGCPDVRALEEAFRRAQERAATPVAP